MQKNLTIKTLWPTDLKQTVLSHGWLNMGPFEWSSTTGTLSRVDRIDSELVRWSVQQASERSLKVTIDGGIAPGRAKCLSSLVKRCLMLEWSPEIAIEVADKLNPKIAEIIGLGGGRFLRGTSFFEDFCKTVCTINTSWKNSVNMVSGLIEHFGSGTFPLPEDILRVSEHRLKKSARLGYRAAVLQKAARHLVKTGLIDQRGAERHFISRGDLLSLYGIGPYAADHLRVLQTDFRRIPVDSEVQSYCQKYLGTKIIRNIDSVNQYFDSWGEFRFIGYKLGRILRNNNWIGD